MVDAASEAIDFASGSSREELEINRLLLHGLVRCLEIIGEAATQLSEETRASMPDLPWAGIRGMRNRLIHAYFSVDTDLVWDTVTFDLPPIVAGIRMFLSRDDGASA